MMDVAKRQRVVCIIEARFRSSRLPGKVVKPILGKPMLARMIERVSRAQTLDAIVVACPDGADDDVVEKIAVESGVHCFRGSEDDVLARVVGAAQAANAEVIVELTGDCPLHEPALIDKVVSDYLLGGADFVSNILPYTTPRGTDVRVFSAASLASIAARSTDPADREHVSLHFWEHPEKYTRRNVESEMYSDAKEFRLTVDTAEDFRLVTAIYESLYPVNPNFTLSDVIGLLDARPDLRAINEHVGQKAVRQVLRAAVIGCGKIGSELSVDPLLKGDVFTHAEAYSRCEDTTLVALCDSDSKKLAAAGELWGISALYSNATEMLVAESLDVVSICTPTATHGDVLRAVLDASTVPRGILCEKPLGLSLEESEYMAGLARGSGTLLATVYMRRYANNFRNLRTFLDDGGIGELQAITGLYIKGTFHNGTHWFDMLRYLAGEVDWVCSYNGLRETRDDPTLDVILGMKTGAIASLRACDHTAYTVFEMELIGSAGRVRIIDSGFGIELYRPQPSARYAGYVELQRDPMDFGDRRNLMLHAVRDMVSALAEGREPACTAADGVAAARIADAAVRGLAGRVNLQAPLDFRANSTA